MPSVRLTPVTLPAAVAASFLTVVLVGPRPARAQPAPGDVPTSAVEAPPPSIPAPAPPPAPEEATAPAPVPEQQENNPIPPGVEGQAIPSSGGGYCYGGPHPAPGGGWEASQTAHMHDYAPFDLRLFSYRNGCYYFIGDPRDFGYTGQVYSYYGAHPIADDYGGGWCFMIGPHYHWWRPWSPYFTVVGPWYYWYGPYDPFFWAYWPYYSFFYRSYYPGYYAGGRYFRGGYRAAPPIARVPATGWRGSPRTAVAPAGSTGWRTGPGSAGSAYAVPGGAVRGGTTAPATPYGGGYHAPPGGYHPLPGGARPPGGGWRPPASNAWRGGSVPGPHTGGGGFHFRGGHR